jgi:U3 small nucleolar RNA-associated protein 5
VIKNVVVKKTVMELAAPAMSDDVSCLPSERHARTILTATLQSHQPIPVKRFNADSATAGRATTIAFADEEAARLSRTQLELPVEGELADLTLGERLAVMEGNLPAVQRDGAVSDEDDDEDADEDEAPAGKSERKTKETGAVPTQLPIQTTQSLTRLLSQALHSSDQPLLSLILTSTTNSTPTLVRNTIRKMPASLALPLLKACVDRLGKGKQYDRRGGGRGGAIAPQQGRGVVAWIKGVLVERGSVLMAVSWPSPGQVS